jgi:hypothetical protein
MMELDHETQACIRLWAAVFRLGLADAALHFRNTGEQSPWISCDDRHPGSFIWLCELFDIDPDYARSAARQKYRELVKSVKWL